MKINWGLRIVVLYMGFVVFMLTLVYKCTQQKFDLVSKDYYAKELAYGGIIEGHHNKSILETPVSVGLGDGGVQIQLPASQKGLQKGMVLFYRPSDAGKDVEMAFNSISHTVPLAKFSKGVYKVKITWENKGKQYFDEQGIYIP